MSLFAFMSSTEVWDMIESKSKPVRFEDVVFSVVAHLKCQNCGMFGRNYHCCTTPPYQRARDILKRYDHFRWFWIGKDCQERIDDMMAREDLGSSDYITHKLALTQVNAVILGKIRKDCEMLKSYFREKKRAFKLFGPGGGCTKCKPCNKLREPRLPCSHPDTTQGSAEGFGIDVYASLKKAGIEIQIPPMTYLMTVGMIAWSE